MASPQGHSASWGVHLSAVIARSLRQVQRQASDEGRGEEVLAAFRQVIEELRRAPLNFGEPLYQLPGLHLLIRSGSVRPLVVDFAVSEDVPIVYIKGVKLLARREGE